MLIPPGSFAVVLPFSVRVDRLESATTVSVHTAEAAFREIEWYPDACESQATWS
jgi:hypothetical protein